jgi:Caspase domain
MTAGRVRTAQSYRRDYAMSCLILGPGRAQADEPSKLALLIGVSNYKPSGLVDLDGPLNDVALMRKVLQDRFGVPAANIQTLSNALASHSAIAAAFAELKAKLKRGDFVYVHYSGHGSTAADENDRRGEDQTWVPYGARGSNAKGLDGLDVLDKEIGVWLRAIATVSPNIIFVSDSCHSATVARGRSLGVRGVAPAMARHPLLNKLPRDDTPLAGIRIGAARDFEPAVEFDPVTGGPCEHAKRCNGVFTWYWAQALERSQPGDS